MGAAFKLHMEAAHYEANIPLPAADKQPIDRPDRFFSKNLRSCQPNH